MACPYFFPEQPLEGPRPSRAPLGDIFSGTCAVTGVVPERSILVEICNYGYARGRCECYPAGSLCDALRFSARDSDPASVEVTYIREKDWTPVEFGRLKYSRLTGVLSPTPGDDALARQSLAFAARFPCG